MNYKGRPVFTWEIDWSDPVNGRWQFDLREIELGFGPEITDIQQDHIIHGFEFRVQVRDDDVDNLNDFLDELEGRSKPFWLPGPSAQFVIISAPTSTTFTVYEQGSASSWTLHPGGYVCFTKLGETSVVSKITGIVNNGDGTETVTIADAVTIDSSWQVFPLYLVRLADDTEKVEVLAERWQRRSFRVVEMPKDYDTITAIGTTTDPSTPVYLYRFTAPLPDGDVVWRFTSHPTDVTIQSADQQSSSSSSSSADALSFSSSSSLSTPSSQSSSSDSSSSSPANQSTSSSSSDSSLSISSSSSSPSSSSSRSSSSSSSSAESSSSSSGPVGETFLAVPIEHSRLSRSTKLGGTVAITADYDTVEPLRLCVPMRLSVPLRVEILRTTTAFIEPETLFNGVVLSPELNGRKVKVSCTEWGSAMDRKLPGFFIQRTCNYRVYDMSTCRADRASKQVTVNITGVNGRLLTVQSASLAGLPLNWFAEGWIELGSGLQRRILFVSGNFAATGTSMVLTVTNPLDLELPQTGVLVPGCDGNRSTCIAKFDNLVNFGGHETPKSNLTLTAIKAKQKTGGKK